MTPATASSVAWKSVIVFFVAACITTADGFIGAATAAIRVEESDTLLGLDRAGRSFSAESANDVIVHLLLAGPRARLTASGLTANCNVASLHIVPGAAAQSPDGARSSTFVAALRRDSDHNACSAYLTSSATLVRRTLDPGEKLDPALIMEAELLMLPQQSLGEIAAEQHNVFRSRESASTAGDGGAHRHVASLSRSPALHPLQLLVFGHGRWFEAHALRRCGLAVLEEFEDADDHSSDSSQEAGCIISIRASSRCLDAVVALPSVRWVELRPAPSLHNDVATKTLQSEFSAPDSRAQPPVVPNAGNSVGRPVWESGLTGEGEVLGISDSGVDVLSCFFHDPNETVALWPEVNHRHRKVITYRPSTVTGDKTDLRGHGTHVAASAVGRSVSHLAQHDGMAKDAKLVVLDVVEGFAGALDVPGDLVPFFKQVNETGVKVNSNSWGAAGSTYGAFDRRTDVFMTRNPELLVFFSTGNQGAASLDSPARAKNVIAVGAHHNSFNASLRDTLASFSSRAPTSDGRTKPDLTGPGHAVISAASGGTAAFPHCGVRHNSGTSMAAPLIAGAALLVRQHLRLGSVGAAVPRRPRPLAATMKALMILGAHDMAGVAAPTPNSHEGFGRFRLAPVVSADVIVREGITDMPPLEARQRFDLCFRVSRPAPAAAVNPDGWQDTRAVLVWTDSAAAPEGSTKTLVNDLDLMVSDAQGNTIYGNTKAPPAPSPATTLAAMAQGSTPDRVNNVERVTFAAPSVVETSDYWLSVYAHDIEDDKPFGNWSGFDGSYSRKGQPFSVAVGGMSVTVRDCSALLADNAAWKCPQDSNGRGTCVAGKCQCSAHITGIACEYCNSEALCNGNGQCSPSTKQCTCDATRFNTATDATCGTCAAGYHGPHCTQRCGCEASGHGTCDRTAGTCSCHSSDAGGHWGGAGCDRCARGWAKAALRPDGTTIPSATQCTTPSHWCGTDGAPVDIVVTSSGPVLFQPFDNVATPRMVCVWRFKTPPGAQASWLKLKLADVAITSDDRLNFWQSSGDPFDGAGSYERAVIRDGFFQGNGNVGLIVRFDSMTSKKPRGFTGVVQAFAPPACDTLCTGGCGDHGFCNCTGVAQCQCHESDHQGYWSGGRCHHCSTDRALWPVSSSGHNITSGVSCTTPSNWCVPYGTTTARQIVATETAAFFEPGPLAGSLFQSCPWTIQSAANESTNTWLVLHITNVAIDPSVDFVKVYRGIVDPLAAPEPPILTVSGAGDAPHTVSGDGRVGFTVHYSAKSFQRPGQGFIGRVSAGPPPATCEEKCKDVCLRGTCACPGPSAQPVCTCPADDTSGHWAGLRCGHCKSGYTWADLNSSTWALTIPSDPVSNGTCASRAVWCGEHGAPVDVFVASNADPVLLQVGNDVSYRSSTKCQWHIRPSPGQASGLPISIAVPHIDTQDGDVVRVFEGLLDGFSGAAPSPIATATGRDPLLPMVRHTNTTGGFTVTFVSDGSGNGRGFTAVAALREVPCSAFCHCHGHGQCQCRSTGTPPSVVGTCECSRSDTTGHWDGPRCDRCLKGWTSESLAPRAHGAFGCSHRAHYCSASLPMMTVHPATPVYLLATENATYNNNMACGWRLQAAPEATSLTITFLSVDTAATDKIRVIDGQPQNPFSLPNSDASVKVVTSGKELVSSLTAAMPHMGVVVTFTSDASVNSAGFIIAVTAGSNDGTDSDSGSDSSQALTSAPGGCGACALSAVIAVCVLSLL